MTKRFFHVTKCKEKQFLVIPTFQLNQFITNFFNDRDISHITLIDKELYNKTVLCYLFVTLIKRLV